METNLAEENFVTGGNYMFGNHKYTKLKYLLILLLSYSNIIFSQNINIKLIDKFSINTITSASGIEQINKTTYIISDDQANIFSTNDFIKINKTKIINTSDKRIDKTYKPDFEALGKVDIKNKDFLIIVSSGSRINFRDTIFLYNPATNKIISKRNFRTIYNKMKIQAQFKKIEAINIEAISSNKKYIYLFQRGNIYGNNVIFRFNKSDFFQYLIGKRNSLDFEYKKFELPLYNNTKSGFSGACYLNEENIIFTASLETSATAYADGKILGSYIGIVNYNTEDIKYTLFKEKEKTIITKIESVCIIDKTQKKNLTLLLSSDNDNGISEFYKIIFSY